jgi:hypothetical protein
MKLQASDLQEPFEIVKREYGVRIPVMTKKDALEKAAQLRKNLSKVRKIPLTDTAALLDKCARLWLNYNFREKPVKVLSEITNQSVELTNLELESTMKMLLRENIEATVTSELGSPSILDEWIPSEHGETKRESRGIVFHNISGNAFVVIPVSIAMGLLSKNCNLVKVSKDEPFFAYSFFKSLCQIDDSVKDRLTVGYFDSSDSEIYETIIKESNCVVHWGGIESEKAISSLCTKYYVKLISHGPKISFEVIDDIPDSEDQVAEKVAYDMTAWEQKACFSPRILFVNKRLNPERFAESLATSLQQLTKKFPKKYSTAWNSIKTIQDRQLCIEKYGLTSGIKSYTSFNADYTILLLNGMPEREDINHCFYRFIFICPYDDFQEVEDWVGTNIRPYLQTMGYAGNNENFINDMAEAGVTTITQPGEMALRKPGISHDGFSNLTELTYAVSRQSE